MSDGRMTVGRLARRFSGARIVFTGGSGRIVYDGVTEASLAARLFESFGIARERIVLEDKSRDTDENARFTRELLQPKPDERWLLVTSAHHMPRSIGVFRAVGFAVEAYPVDFPHRGRVDLLRPSPMSATACAARDTEAREWVGLLVYRGPGGRLSCFRGR